MFQRQFTVDANFAMLAPRMHQLVAAVCEIVQTSAPVAIHAVVTSAALAVNLRPACVTSDGRRRQPLHIFPFLVAESGSSKSPALDLVLRAVKERDARLLAAHSKAKCEFEAEVAAWKANKPKNCKANEDLLMTHARQRPQKKALRRIIIENEPFSTIVDHVSDGLPHLVLSDELFTLKRSGLMRDGRIAPVYSGDPLVDDNRTRGTVIAAKPRVVVSTDLQPVEFRRWMAESEGSLRGSGALARMTFMCSVPNFGFRDFTRDHSAAHLVIDRYAAWLTDQLDRHADFNQPEEVHHLNPDAIAVFNEWRTWLEARQSPCGPLHAIRDAATKAADQVIRVAAIIEWLESGTTIVGPNSVRAAIILIELSLANYSTLVGPDTGATIAANWAPRLLDWLKTQLIFSWHPKRIAVLRTDCPPEVCPRSHWQPALEELEQQQMLCTRKGSLALTPKAWGFLMPTGLPALR
jgi:hypothetical protein